MIEEILKRDGLKQKFESYKIEDVIKKAFKSVNIVYSQAVFFNVIEALKQKRVVAVEDIQDLIEKELYKARYFEVMKSFMMYRHLHKIQREQILQIDSDTTYINSTQTIQEYINGSDWRIKANSNTGYSHAGLINNSAGKVIANYWLDKVYSKEEGYAHRNADYHIHDLDCLSGYCAGWSLRVLLDEGFNGVRGRVESVAPNHFREALGQMANFLGILQSEWAGAQAFSSFDTYLAPYVYKDKLSYSEIKKAIRSFIYNLNVPARWGQSPFTNITIDWTVPEDLKDQIPTRNQEHLLKDIDETLTYKDFQKEMNLINKAYYEVMTEGDKTGQPFTFPIPTVNITEDFDWYGENTDVLFENTAKIGSSYFQNFIGSQYIKDENGKLIPNDKAYKPGHVRSMCCRLQLDLRELLKRGGGLFGSAEMTGSIGVVTINMARLGFLYKNDVNALLKRLEELMVLAKSTLEKKRVFVQDMYDRGLFPYTQRYLPGFNNHFSTIGVNGMNEMIKNYFGENIDLSSEIGNTFCNEILDFMRDKMVEFQEETGNLYNLEATPAEGTTYRFAKEDKKRFKNIIQAGFDDNIYYTNSSQLPVDFTNDPFEALELQDELQCKYTGGTVLHLYMSERLSSTDACRKFVKNSITNFKLPYITVTPLFSVCEVHGYLNGEHEFCPKCDEEILEKELKNEETRIA
ncbi:ribonucleoside triphosphate reductase [Poseidonibacter ostreae]|mgnify:FL=1|jgi:ribonucleoside-triphosphate reductase (formate)|uniref:Ribonucleoside triphosphate reductase n=1 Tax=Poseidonibacter ostreae TaxID=2654171 RepID=A0A6L4WSM5_9BACT|nr:ribonucleoside triphosphate reductase [Poseidonibacter ostreae]KAB7887123.1 ribonucleoside triphosphate reductase [Poseidonibacter ostreae]KAB7888629.1 ribonucleoside triphosphate reductase [Poseidonibacter ostreae]KAB7892324.1 ribonucleoside triphosphate reductase [Poseidonibacter ostreae]MAC82781.1 ribonucleoside triphosphate reductase [Arcobacter sp.]|tara:strand:+ start:1331 stop:3397 length:2067 start_codon:yes stop_codon:yes gene_type:complete